LFDENDYIRYSPRFDIKRALEYRVQVEKGRAVDQVELPSELVDASAVLASDLLAMADWLCDLIDEGTAEIRSCLKGKMFDGLSVEDYDRAVESGDYETVYRFEEFNCADLSGSSGAEIYALLKDIKRRTEWLREFVQKNIAPAFDTSGNTQRLAEKEEEHYSNLAYMEYTNPGSIDRLSLAYEAQLKFQITKRMLAFADAVEQGMEVFRLTIDDSCGGDAGHVAAGFASGGADAVQHIITTLGVAFGELADKGLAIMAREARIDSVESCKRLQQSAMALFELRSKAVSSAAGFLNAIDANDLESPGRFIAECLLDGLESISVGLDTTILDLYKMQKMEELLLQERLDNILQRKRIRQFVTLAKAVAAAVDFSGTEEQRKAQCRMVGAIMGSKKGDVC
jgi:hypothetical protein